MTANKRKKKLLPKFKESSVKQSVETTSSASSVDLRKFITFSDRANSNGNANAAGVTQGQENKKTNFVVDTFDATNPVDVMRGIYGDKIPENITEQDLAKIVTKAASLVSFTDKESPEKTYNEKEALAKFEARGVKVTDSFRDPYDSISKLQFHDAGRYSGVVSQVLSTFATYAVGTDFPKISIDVNRSYPSGDMEREELAKMSYSPAYFLIKNELEKLDRKVGLRHVLIATIIQGKQFGRACALIQDSAEKENIEGDDFTLPIAIKPLSSMRLGRVLTNALDWDSVEGVQYYDFAKPNDIIFKENMIYAVNRNYHQSPNAYNYGLSDIELVKHLVELNLVIDGMDLRQINKRNWTPLQVITVPDTEDPARVAALKLAYKRFTSVFTTVQHDHKTVELNQNGDFLLTERTLNDEKISTDSGMPLLLMGRKTYDTKATASQVLQGFNATTVKEIRMWIRETFEPQWYNRNIMVIIKKLAANLKAGIKDPIVEEEREIFKEYLKKSKEDKFTKILQVVKNSNLYFSINGDPATIERIETLIRDKIDEEFRELSEPEAKTYEKLLQYSTPEDLPFKIKMQFSTISFDTDIEKSAYVSGLIKDEIIDTEKGQEILGYDSETEKAKLDDEAKDILTDLMLEIGLTPPTPIPQTPEQQQDQQNKENGDENDEQGDEMTTEENQRNTLKTGMRTQSLNETRNRRANARVKTGGV